MAFRASSSCARGLLAGDSGLTPNPGASLPHQWRNADGSLWGKRQDLTPLPNYRETPKSFFTSVIDPLMPNAATIESSGTSTASMIFFKKAATKNRGFFDCSSFCWLELSVAGGSSDADTLRAFKISAGRVGIGWIVNCDDCLLRTFLLNFETKK